MNESEYIEGIAAEGRDMSRDFLTRPELLEHVVPFGPISGIAENLKRQSAYVREHGVPQEFALLSGPEVTYMSILKELGILQLSANDRRIFIEYFHPYYNLLEDRVNADTPAAERITRRGVPELAEAFILGNQLHQFMNGLDIEALRTIFVDNVTQSRSSQVLDEASKAGMILTRIELPYGVTIYDTRVGGKMTGQIVDTDPDEHPKFFDTQVKEASTLLDAQQLAQDIAAEAARKGYRVQGKRGKIHFKGHEPVNLYDKDGRPSCEVLDLAYRRFMTWDNNSDEGAFHGGVIILPESFRRQQERVRRISQLMGWDQNIVTVLQD